MGALLVTAIQTIVSREVNPAHPSVVTVGRFSAGEAANVIAENAVLEGSIRALDVEVRESLPHAYVLEGDATHDDSLLDVEKPRYPPNARHLYAPPSALTVNYNWIILDLAEGPPPVLSLNPETSYAKLSSDITLSPYPGRASRP